MKPSVLRTFSSISWFLSLPVVRMGWRRPWGPSSRTRPCRVNPGLRGGRTELSARPLERGGHALLLAGRHHRVGHHLGATLRHPARLEEAPPDAPDDEHLFVDLEVGGAGRPPAPRHGPPVRPPARRDPRARTRDAGGTTSGGSVRHPCARALSRHAPGPDPPGLPRRRSGPR